MNPPQSAEIQFAVARRPYLGWGVRFIMIPPTGLTLFEVAEFRKPVLIWCTEQFGEPNRLLHTSGPERWAFSQCDIFFKKDEDAVAFKTRWG